MRGLGRPLKRVGSHKYTARCPAHDDEHASLSVTVGNDGRLLLYCFAGCDFEEIMRGVNLEPQAAFPDYDDRPPHRRLGQRPPARDARAPRTRGTSGTVRPPTSYRRKEDAIEAAARLVQRANQLAECPTRTDFEYLAGGEVVAVSLRFDLPPGSGRSKDIRPIARGENGWTITAPPAPRPLFRVDELTGDGPVFMGEGEVCALALVTLGLAGTTSFGGSNAPQHSDWSPMAGRDVYILVDRDKAGEGYGQKVAQIAVEVGARHVYIIRLWEHESWADLPVGGDIADVLDSPDETPESVRTKLETLIERAELVEPAERLSVTRMDRVEPQTVEWVWPGRIPAGKLTMIVGDPSAGKSFLSMDIAARVSTGVGWPDDPGATRSSADVLLLNDEDGLADTIHPRLVAAEANLARVHHVGATRRWSDDGEATYRPFHLAADLRLLEDELKRHPNSKLIIIDPINAYISGTDAHKDVDIRSILTPLAQLAERTGISVVAICHLRKSAGKAIHSVLGSIGYVGVARVVWLVALDQDNRERRLFLPLKNNLAPLGLGLAYRIVAHGDMPRLEWESEPVDNRADDFTISDDGRRDQSAVDEAADWLKDVLAVGPVPSKELDKRAEEDGIRPRTLRRAKKTLGVRPFRSGAIWACALPQPSDATPGEPTGCRTELGQGGQVGQAPEAGHVGQLDRWR